VDLRGSASEPALVETMLASFASARETRERLVAQLPRTLAQAAFQLDYIAGFLAGNSISGQHAGTRHAA
jgi:hypothetical protein